MRERLRVVRMAFGLAVRAGGRLTVVILLLNVLVTVGAAGLGLLMKLLADRAAEGDWRGAALAAAGLTVQIVAASTATWTSSMLRYRVDEQARHLFELELMDLAGRIPTLEVHEHPDFVERMELLRENPAVLTGAIWATYNNVNLFVQAITTGALLVSVHPLLLVLPIFGLPTLCASGVQARRNESARERTAESQRRLSHLFDLATTAEAGKELRTFRLQDTIRSRYDAEWKNTDADLVRTDMVSTLVGTVAWLAFCVGYLGAIAFVSWTVARGRGTPGDLLLVIVLAGRMQNDVTGGAATVSNLTSTLTGATRYLWLVDFAATQHRASTGTKAPDRLTKGITVEHVSFGYPDAAQPTLQDVSLSLPAGSIVAVVGENGAGKTTLIKLLARLYEPTTGQILLDDVPAHDIDVDDYRRRLSGAFQDFVRPELPLREAVGIGDLDRLTDDAQVSDAIARGGASSVVDGLESGLDTQLGRTWPGGLDLSGGQWQKVAISRGFMRDEPLLLLLDEPTSALDPHAEHEIFSRFATAAATARERTGAITILVSHRFSTVSMADLIVVVEAGRVIETGSHDDLITADGLYAELYRIHARAYS